MASHRIAAQSTAAVGVVVVVIMGCAPSARVWEPSLLATERTRTQTAHKRTNATLASVG